MEFKRIIASVMLALLAVANPLVAATNDYVSFTFSNQDIRDVVRMIARSTGSNIITEKNVQGKISLSLKDVYYERALELVAKANGYVVRKVDNTYIVGPADKLAAGFDIGLNRTYKLNYAEAESVSKVISGIFKKAEVPIEVSVDTRVNAVVVSGTQTALDKIDELIKSIDIPVHQVMIEAKIVEINTMGERDLGFSWTWGVKRDPSGDNSGKIFHVQEFQAKRADNVGYFAQPDAVMGEGYGDPFKIGDYFRSPTAFEAMFSAVETTGNGKILSNPKIMAMNGKEATVQIGEQVIYTGGATQPPQEKDVGVILTITPRINDEGWVTMDVEPIVSEAQWRSLKGGGEYQYPSITKRQAKTTVRVRDGEEILIGGLITQNDSKSNVKLPIHGDVPIFKSLFSKNSNNKSTRELIILITPHIIMQNEG
ncbi:MAG: secretin N-terminal domain-containing protein [Candidatus Wallbacteria bacterium]|nr:secretin N-terminal domain-containing protein [Candidatus Wallbacteria bacterium]